MAQKSDRPKICIKSKLDLIKGLSHGKFLKKNTESLVNDVLKNYNKYWRDNRKESKPLKNKWVRSAKDTPLGRLLHRIDDDLLAPYDALIPEFIFGGRGDSSHVKATAHLQGAVRKRTLLKLDLSRFFEQVSQDRVIKFLIRDCGCSYKGAKLIANLCCVPLGRKGSGSSEKAIARGFATSSRIAVWCSVDLFKKMNELVQKRLKGHDPRIAIYIDDIGITATKVKKATMLKLSYDIKKLLEHGASSLKLNDEKREIVNHREGMEHLGIRMYRKGLGLGKKSFSKKAKTRHSLKCKNAQENKEKLKIRLGGMYQYEKYIKRQKS